jgi:hypothetical protein
LSRPLYETLSEHMIANLPGSSVAAKAEPQVSEQDKPSSR